MARIRTIKPSLWESERIGRLPVLARLTFIGLIGHADDAGRGRGAIRFLMGALHPYASDVSDSDLSSAIAALHNAKVAVFYEVDGCKYYHLPGWKEHQRIEKPGKSVIPEPPESEPGLFDDQSATNHRRVAGESPEEGKGREGNRTGMERDGKTDNVRASPTDLKKVISDTASKMVVTEHLSGEWGEYRLPKDFGTFSGAYIINLPANDCRFILETMKPGPKIREALLWRIKLAESEKAQEVGR